MSRVAGITYAAFAILSISLSAAQQRRDPLTPAEINQLRDAAQDPDQRLKLFVQFARARLTSLEQMRADPKVTDRDQDTHDNLQDFLDVYDELDDNVDTFVDRGADLRKILKFVIEADSEFAVRLRALKNNAQIQKENTSAYEFLLTSALDTLKSSTEDHRELLAQQEQAFKRKKK